MGGTHAYCSSGWVEASYNTCYKFVDHPKLNWTSALNHCRSEGGKLAVLDTIEKIIWIRGYRSFYRNIFLNSAWIGGFKRASTWFWKGTSVDTPVTITDWAPGQPNGGPGTADCVCAFGVGHGDPGSKVGEDAQFRNEDTGCNSRLAFICERPAN